MIEYFFDNWILRPMHQHSQQYDNMSTMLKIINAPTGWDTWYAIISRKGYLNQIELDVSEDNILTHIFSEQELAFSGTYSLQIQAAINNKRKHTKLTTFEAGQTLSGDAKWVELPTVFSDAVAQATDAKHAALAAAESATEASKHYPKIDEITGNWLVWDVMTGEYVDSGIHAQGPPGPAGSTYVYTQSYASDRWYIEHPMNSHPSVTVVDSGDNIVVGDVTYVDLNHIDIKFMAPFSGKAYLN